MSESFHVNFSSVGPGLLEKKIFKDIFSYVDTCKNKKGSPFGAQQTPGEHDFIKLAFVLVLEKNLKIVLTVCQLPLNLSKVWTFASHLLKDALKLFP
jgi:hypothetical protein